MSIADNLAHVRDRVARAARGAGRDPAEITLVAVSKLQPAAQVREAWLAGCRDFGENYAQELCQKATELAALEPIRWHHIGHLQRNKLKQLVGRVALFHGVDRPALVDELEARSAAQGCVSEILLQVNVAGEAQKSGCEPAALAGLVAAARRSPHVRLRGLMTMPPLSESTPHFLRLRELAEEHGRDLFPDLSMGMSLDYEAAIAAGATLVRVGTAIFGERT